MFINDVPFLLDHNLNLCLIYFGIASKVVFYAYRIFFKNSADIEFFQHSLFFAMTEIFEISCWKKHAIVELQIT